MKYESAFDGRLAHAGLTQEEWDRLPWLFDEPRRRRRPLSSRLLALLVLLVAVDAIGSYAAGRASNEWTRTVRSQEVALSAQDAQALARAIFAPASFGWYRKRANAAY